MTVEQIVMLEVFKFLVLVIGGGFVAFYLTVSLVDKAYQTVELIRHKRAKRNDL